VARQFPEITSYASAFSFALEAERACADIAAAADILAANETWREKFEEIVCAHDDRVEKLAAQRQAADVPVRTLHAQEYLPALGGEPAQTWPAIAQQLIAAELAAARFEEEFARECAAILGSSVRLFAKSAEQARTCAEELQALLG
jgi:hypothetical protein